MVKFSIQYNSTFGKSLIFQLLSVEDANVVEVENMKDVFPSFLLKFDAVWLHGSIASHVIWPGSFS